MAVGHRDDIRASNRRRVMANGNILSDFGINILEEDIDDVIF